MTKRAYPLSRVYGLLEPGPVLLLTTAHKGKANVMTLSWHTMMEFEPPLVGCIVSNRDFSFAALKASRQCVLNIPTRELAAQVVGCGNTTGRTIDKFETFALTREPASLVAAPFIKECYAQLECRVVDTRALNRYGLFRPCYQGTRDAAPPGTRRVPRGLRNHPLALEDEMSSGIASLLSAAPGVRRP